MGTAAVKFLSIFFTALALIPSGAHLMGLLNKIHAPAQVYLSMQQTYRGWALSGVAVFGALLATFALAILLRRWPGLTAARVAFLCILVTQCIFWSVTFPVNQATDNWTMLPANWEALRVRWEYSHAVSGVLNVIALGAVTIAVLRSGTRRHELNWR